MLASLVVVELNGKFHKFRRGTSGRFKIADLRNAFREAGRIEAYCTPQGWYLEGADGRTMLNYVTGRPLRFDPRKQRFVDDKEANSYISQPMRGNWKLS
jgi:hypothetical protein